MGYRAFASLLAIATVAPFASGVAHAEPLTIGACEELKSELTRLDSVDVTRALDEGPDWAKKNLSGEQLDSAKRYVYVEELVRFRCPARDDPNGKPPPLPAASPHRAEKIKELEALTKAEAAKQAEADKQAEEARKQAEAEAERQKAAEAEAAKQAAKQAEAEKQKAAEENAPQVSGGIAPQPFDQKPVGPQKAAASVSAGAEPLDIKDSIVKTRMGSEDATAPIQDAEGKKASADRPAPLSADGIVPGEKEDPAMRNPVRHQRASRAEPVQAMPVDAERLKAARSELERRSAEQADDNSWFSFFRRSFR